MSLIPLTFFNCFRLSVFFILFRIHELGESFLKEFISLLFSKYDTFLDLLFSSSIGSFSSKIENGKIFSGVIFELILVLLDPLINFFL